MRNDTDNASANFIHILFHELFHFALLRELAEIIEIIDRRRYPSFRQTLTASIFAGIIFCKLVPAKIIQKLSIHKIHEN